jgi:hypothetical protein
MLTFSLTAGGDLPVPCSTVGALTGSHWRRLGGAGGGGRRGAGFAREKICGPPGIPPPTTHRRKVRAHLAAAGL